MPTLLLLGPGYTARHIDAALRGQGWYILTTTRTPGPTAHPERTEAPPIPFADPAAVASAIAQATHILSSIPPAGDADPVLALHAPALTAAAARGAWLAYLSSTGVYGDTAGAWVDECAPVIGAATPGRRTARARADALWQALGAHVFRLPGIYGPGRSALDRVRGGRAHRIDQPDQIFSRLHVADIASAVLATIATEAPPAIWNLADDLPAPQNDVIAHACALLGAPLPPLQSLAEANLSPMAAGFYAENRRIAAGRAKRLLGWRPRYPTYREGLAAILDVERRG